MTARPAACLLLLATATTAAAGPLPSPPWSYRAPANEISFFSPGAAGGVSFPNTPFAAGPADGMILATLVVSSSVAPADTPDLTSTMPYQFAVELRDDASGEAARLSFAGVLSGSFWRTGADVTNVFTGPTTRSADLGGHRYTLSLTGFAPPTGYGDALAGGISASVTADGAIPAGPVATPEPATALLALVGLPAMAILRATHRRRIAC